MPEGVKIESRNYSEVFGQPFSSWFLLLNTRSPKLNASSSPHTEIHFMFDVCVGSIKFGRLIMTNSLSKALAIGVFV